jgi:hypothetical protein
VAGARFGDHQPFDECLRSRCAAAALADLDHARGWRRILQYLRIDQVIDQYDVGALDRAHRL